MYHFLLFKTLARFSPVGFVLRNSCSDEEPKLESIFSTDNTHELFCKIMWWLSKHFAECFLSSSFARKFCHHLDVRRVCVHGNTNLPSSWSIKFVVPLYKTLHILSLNKTSISVCLCHELKSHVNVARWAPFEALVRICEPAANVLVGIMYSIFCYFPLLGLPVSQHIVSWQWRHSCIQRAAWSGRRYGSGRYNMHAFDVFVDELKRKGSLE